MERPIDRKNRVVEYNSVIACRIVELIDFVCDYGVRLERAESVGETRRNEDLLTTRDRELNRSPSAIGRRIHPQIDHHIEYATRQNANQLRLRRRWALKMEAADRTSLAGKRLIVLYETRSDAEIGQGFLIICLDEITPGVGNHPRSKEDHARKRLAENIQARDMTANFGNTRVERFENSYMSANSSAQIASSGITY